MRDEDITKEETIRMQGLPGGEGRPWSLAFEKSGLAVWEWHVPEHQFFYSPKLGEMLGPGGDPRHLPPWPDLAHPLDGQKAKDHLAAILMEEDQKGGAEYRIRRTDGTYRWVRVTGFLRSRGEDGAPLLAVGLVADITGYKEADHKFSKMAGAIPASIFIIQDGHICYANRYTEAMIGYTSQELYVMDPWACIHSDMRDMVRARIAARSAGRPGPSRYEVRLVSKSGREFMGDLTTTMITYRGGPAIMGFIYDITERKRGEEALRESESKYRALFQQANDAIFLMKGETIIDCNAKTLEMFRCSMDQIVGKTPFDLSPPLQPGEGPGSAPARVRIPTALSGLPQVFEWKHRRLDGTLFDAEVSLARVELAGHHYLHSVARDITDRKEREEALRESEHKFRELAEKSLMGIYLIQGPHFKYVNARFAEIHGYNSPDEMIDTIDHRETLHPEDRPALHERHQKRLSGEMPTSHYGFRIVTRKGEVRNVEAFGSLTTYRGEPAVIGTLLDVTERKKAEEKIKRSEAGLRALIGSMTDTITIVDREGRYATVNLRNLDTLFTPSAVRLERSLSSAIPGAAAASFAMAVRKALKTRTTVNIEHPAAREGSGKRWFATAISPMTDDTTVCVSRDITDLKTTEDKLRAKSESLEETNSALKVLLRNMEGAKKELEEDVVANIRVLVMPHVEKLARVRLEGKEKAHVDAIQKNLRHIASPFLRHLNQFNLTPMEIQVANYVRDGYSTKEIIELMHGTKTSIDMHRYHIRRKLGINGIKTNLRSYLLSLR